MEGFTNTSTKPIPSDSKSDKSNMPIEIDEYDNDFDAHSVPVSAYDQDFDDYDAMYGNDFDDDDDDYDGNIDLDY